MTSARKRARRRRRRGFTIQASNLDDDVVVPLKAAADVDRKLSEALTLTLV